MDEILAILPSNGNLLAGTVRGFTAWLPTKKVNTTLMFSKHSDLYRLFYIFVLKNTVLTFGPVMICSQVTLLCFLAYTRMWLQILDHSKPGSFHGSSSLSETLRDCAGVIEAALVDLHGFWVVCFNVKY